ncbi:hypothetical protein HALLA_00005 (plasmid) [Halostagnicola larsenii XH-48]|uniref:Uncharacterized protein n=1 Tax=Halostagnicola larsenii XH-48 TaxID=797299 RepID=W0JWU6_9EURY|nr:hypothetical protein HALLA_00005 [Halostagnicola larsenii XH-48]
MMDFQMMRMQNSLISPQTPKSTNRMGSRTQMTSAICLIRGLLPLPLMLSQVPIRNRSKICYLNLTTRRDSFATVPYSTPITSFQKTVSLAVIRNSRK